MPRTNNNGLAVIVIVLGLTTLGALGYYVVQPKAKTVPVEESRQPKDTTFQPEKDLEITVKPRQQDSEVTVLTPDFVDNDLVFWRDKVQVPEGQDPRVFAVNQYLAKISAVPPDARLLSCTMDDSTAVANFSEALFAGYGTEDEQVIINGILATFGMFPDVKSVRFQVGGQTIETLGNIEIKDPQPVIRPN